MRVTVIHNPAAGDEAITAEQILDALRAAGHEAAYASTRTDDWATAVQEADDAVLAVGGDGTIGKAARQLLGRDVPLAMLPFGTANNIAGALGVHGDWRELIDRLHTWEVRRIDTGSVSGPWGDLPFLEGVGCGLFAEAMAVAESDRTEVARRLGRDVELVCDLTRVRSLLQQLTPRRCRLRLDGRVIAADVLLLAVMNIRSVGPRLLFAPEARPDDGRLHVAIAYADQRSELDAYLENRLEGEPAVLRLEQHAAREVNIDSAGGGLHVDDELVCTSGRVEISCAVVPAALPVLLPPGS